MDIERSFDRFIKDRQAQQCSPRHIDQLRHKFKMFGTYLRSHGVADTSDLTSEICADFILRYIEPENGRQYSAWYIRGIANTVRAYLLFCLR